MQLTPRVRPNAVTNRPGSGTRESGISPSKGGRFLAYELRPIAPPGALIFWSPAPLTERTTPRPAFVIGPAFFSTLFERTMRSISIARMEKPRPRSAGLLRFGRSLSSGASVSVGALFCRLVQLDLTHADSASTFVVGWRVQARDRSFPRTTRIPV